MEWDDHIAQTCILKGVDENKNITILRNMINHNTHLVSVAQLSSYPYMLGGN
jgi:hypothetical protein